MTLAQLTDRGLRASIGLDGKLHVGPAKKLTQAMRMAIKANRDAIYYAVLDRDWAEFEYQMNKKPKHKVPQ